MGKRGAASPVVLLGVASSAGSHHAGQELATAALRAAGFVDFLRDAGLTVADLGDIVAEVVRVDQDNPTTRDTSRVSMSLVRSQTRSRPSSRRVRCHW